MNVAVFKQEKLPSIEDRIYQSCAKMIGERYRIIGTVPNQLKDSNGLASLDLIGHNRCSLFTAALIGKPVIYIKYDNGRRHRIDTDAMLLKEYAITPVMNFAISDGFTEKNSIFSGIHDQYGYYVIGQKLRMRIRKKEY